jgi:hypothetical protein
MSESLPTELSAPLKCLIEAREGARDCRISSGVSPWAGPLLPLQIGACPHRLPLPLHDKPVRKPAVGAITIEVDRSGGRSAARACGDSCFYVR